MSYEIFDQKKTRIGRPAATINPAGRIYFNQEAAVWLLTHRVKRVLLLWNQDDLMMGIRTAKSNDLRAYSVNYSSKGGGAGITAKSFLNWIGFKVDQASVTVDAVLNDENPLIELELPAECLEDE